ncbi:MAG TPA: DUF4105 domain-containing protein [Candidatus Gracilibacteria bacterium]
MIKILKQIFKWVLIAAFFVILIFTLTVLGFNFLRKPSNSRSWDSEQAKLAHATLEQDIVTIHDLRYFKYDATGGKKLEYEDRVYDLETLEGLDFVVSYFSESDAIAHTFLTFRFKDQPGLSVSIEARREQGESYSPFKGIFGKYELIYVLGDERDIIGLRSHIRQEPLYLYPTKASKETARKIFVNLLERTNELYESPAFYNTLSHNCTNLLARHIEKSSGKKIPLSYKVLLSGHSDELAYDLGLLESDEPFESLKTRSLVDPKGIMITDPEFSQKIRK